MISGKLVCAFIAQSLRIFIYLWSVSCLRPTFLSIYFIFTPLSQSSWLFLCYFSYAKLYALPDNNRLLIDDLENSQLLIYKDWLYHYFITSISLRAVIEIFKPKFNHLFEEIFVEIYLERKLIRELTVGCIV